MKIEIAYDENVKRGVLKDIVVNQNQYQQKFSTVLKDRNRLPKSIQTLVKISTAEKLLDESTGVCFVDSETKSPNLQRNSCFFHSEKNTPWRKFIEDSTRLGATARLCRWMNQRLSTSTLKTALVVSQPAVVIEGTDALIRPRDPRYFIHRSRQNSRTGLTRRVRGCFNVTLYSILVY